MNNYRSGRAFEYKVKKYFEKKGYLVFRSAGSHSVADLIAIPNQEWGGNGLPILIQCKHYGKISKVECKEAIETYEKYNCDFILAMMEKRKLIFKHIYYHCKQLETYKTEMF